MAGGNKKIHKHPKHNTAGFAQNPQNINRKGRPVSRPMKEMLQEISDKKGKVRFPIEQCRITDTHVTVTVPSMQMLAFTAMRNANAGDVRWFKEIMKLMGEYAPTEIKATVQNIGIKEMSDEELQAEIERLRNKK